MNFIPLIETPFTAAIREYRGVRITYGTLANGRSFYIYEIDGKKYGLESFIHTPSDLLLAAQLEIRAKQPA